MDAPRVGDKKAAPRSAPLGGLQRPGDWLSPPAGMTRQVEYEVLPAIICTVRAASQGARLIGPGGVDELGRDTEMQESVGAAKRLGQRLQILPGSGGALGVKS